MLTKQSRYDSHLILRMLFFRWKMQCIWMLFWVVALTFQASVGLAEPLHVSPARSTASPNLFTHTHCYGYCHDFCLFGPHASCASTNKDVAPQALLILLCMDVCSRKTRQFALPFQKKSTFGGGTIWLRCVNKWAVQLWQCVTTQGGFTRHICHRYARNAKKTVSWAKRINNIKT